MDTKEFRVLIKYCFLKGKNTVQSKTWLDAEFPDAVPGKLTIKEWYAKFGRGEISTEDREHSGRPKEVVTNENIKSTEMNLNDRKLELNEIADTVLKKEGPTTPTITKCYWTV
ncbi:hypothetical protein GWI33_021264 [Rhynchophorus ferrugineus]|uniref:Mos1 transposase HTH domain-containing protein n=1 Tax=Rhynchophorus ferrugineus TaxID=354439 RepID=A0A834HUW8_RHYFE|nr:hypothetical protein GWI33_021264 [Rhynchophorus ferrugineus]